MKVVIVGGGFAGVRAALDLAADRRFDVTLISERADFEYHAALYRSATGRSTLEVLVPLAEIFDRKPVTVIAERAKSVDPAAKKLVGERDSYNYDILILALGVVTEYYGITGLQEFSYGIKSMQEALELKQHLHAQLEDPAQTDNHYVVVGGGPSGVELAAELSSYLQRIYRLHRSLGRFQVELVEAAPTLLPMLPPKLADKIQHRLAKLGVKVETNTPVKGETADSLMLPEGQVKTHTVVWTAGVAGNPFFSASPGVFSLGKGRRVEVDARLQAAENIYVLGDSALTPKSGWAQTAVYDADYVTDNLRGGRSRAYQPKQPVAAIPVGPKWCAVAWGRWRLYGRLGWTVRRWLDLKLYLAILPVRAALHTWLVGSKAEETCPVCRQAR